MAAQLQSTLARIGTRVTADAPWPPVLRPGEGSAASAWVTCGAFDQEGPWHARTK